MATKTELQRDYDRYEQIRRGVAAAEAAKDYPAVVRQAESALPLLHAAVTFQRRFLKLPMPVAYAADAVLRFAPAFFLGKAIDAVEAWYTGGTPTERKALPDIPLRIATARKVLAHAVELWGVLAESPMAVLRPPASPLSAAVVPLWVSVGAVAQHATDRAAYFRVSDLRREAVAKCAGCGRDRRAPLADLLEPPRCPTCQQRCQFVLTHRQMPGVSS